MVATDVSGDEEDGEKSEDIENEDINNDDGTVDTPQSDSTAADTADKTAAVTDSTESQHCQPSSTSVNNVDQQSSEVTF